MPKYSIIIIASNGIALTSKCVESIFQYTKNFELLVIDNNSTDGTSGYLEKKAEANPDIIKIIESKKNLTFAENNNLAIPLCQGEYIIFLNNDTIVTPDWLERMEAHFTRVPFDNVGAVGPVSSMSNGVQMVGRQDPEAWHKQHKGRWRHTGILYGWCMMFKKVVIDKIGGFDPCFVNAYEDNDLSLRAQLAGYTLIVAYDTYIHHVGQGTLKQTMDNDAYEKNGEVNREVYYNKWYQPEQVKKLVAVYRTAAGKHLEASLAQTSKFADSIILHFCRAPRELTVNVDPTGTAKHIYPREEYEEYLKEKFPKIVKIQWYDGIFQEDYERGWLLEQALALQAQGRADWCISVDDDEIYEDKFVERVHAYMNPRNPEIMGYWANWRTIWLKQMGKEYYRTDSTFGSFANYRFFRLIPGQKISSFHPEGHHCGSAPWMPDENLRWLAIRVKHLGYDTPEQRQKKYEFYEANDHFKTRADIGYDDYSHLISLNPQLQEYKERTGISLLMMAKNEEKFIQGTLESMECLVDEYVLVDTGSTDRTRQLMENFAKHSSVPVKILDFPWEDNYSTPRNFGKEHCTQPYILVMDADERFRPQDLHDLFRHSETNNDVMVFNVNNYLEEPTGKGPQAAAPTRSARMFKNIPEIFYTGIIHETVDESLLFLTHRRKVNTLYSPVILHHYGYLKDKKKLRTKLDYYEKLNLRQAEVTEEKDARVFFNLALHYLNDDQEHKALQYLQKTLKLNPKIYMASQQLFALNLKSAKHYLIETLKYMPEQHPARGQTMEILNFLNEKSKGFVKVA